MASPPLRAGSAAEPLENRRDDLVGRRRDIDGDRVARLLERSELAAQEAGRHEMAGTAREALLDQGFAALEVDEAQLRAALGKKVAIGLLERRAGHHGVVAAAALGIDRGADRA